MTSTFNANIANHMRNEIQKIIDQKIGNLVPSRDFYYSESLAADALQAIHKLNKTKDSHIFLMGGGLLGAMREGKLLSHDYDLDLGFLMEEHSIQQIETMFHEAEGFQHISSSDTIVIVDYKGITIDLFGHYPVNNKEVQLSTDIHIWTHDNFDLKSINFMGTKVLIPDPAEKYLDECYGDWQNRKLMYDFSYDSPNRTYKGLQGLIYLTNRLENAVCNGWNSYASMAVSALLRNYGIDYRHLFSMPAARNKTPLTQKNISLFITDRPIVDLAFFAELQTYFVSEEKIIIAVAGEWDKVKDFILIASRLQQVHQVFHITQENQSTLKRIYNDVNIFYSDDFSALPKDNL